MDQRRDLQPVAQADAAESVAKMPDLAVADEVYELMLDRRDSYPTPREGYRARGVQNIEPRQEAHLPRRGEQLSVKIDLARPALAPQLLFRLA
jgi:hypothetical protein